MDLISKGGELVMWRFALMEKNSGIPAPYVDALAKCAAGSSDPLARLIMAEQEQKKGNADKAGRLYLWVMAVSSIWSGPAITEFDTLPEATQLSTCRELLKSRTVEGVGAAYCLLDNAQYEKEAALYLEKAVSNPIGNTPTHAEGFLKGYRERKRIRESQPATSGISPR